MISFRRKILRFTAVIAGCLVLCFLQNFSFAEDIEKEKLTESAGYENSTFYRLIVSPLRVPQEARHVSSDVSVITYEDIEEVPARDPGEALTYFPGVDVTPRTKFGHFTPLSIQGSASRHVLVMVDGIPFNTQASGQADILPQLSLTNIERIEVIQGAASSSWGYALGGVVNLISRDVGHSPWPQGSVTGALSEFRGQKEAFEIRGQANQAVGYYVSGEYLEAGGSRDKDVTQNREDTLQRKFFNKLVWSLSNLAKITSSFGYSNSNIDEGVYPSDGTHNLVPYTTSYGQLRLDLDPDERNHAEAAVKFNRQYIQSNNLDGITDELLSLVKTRDYYYGAELKSMTYHREEDTLVLGYDVSEYILKSSQMDVSRGALLQAPYANYTLVLAPFDVIGGVRYDVNDEFGNQLNPSAGLVYHVPHMRDTLFRANVARAFSAPPLLWKYFKDAAPGITADNPDIRPERAWVYELGMETAAIQGLWMKLGLFRSDISNAINTAVNDDGLFFKKNFERFRQQGIEFESKAKVNSQTTLSFSSGFNDVVDRATDETVRNRGVTRPNFRIGCEWNGPYGISMLLNARYERWDSSPDVQPNDRKFILDGRLSQKIPGGPKDVTLTVFLNVYNLTNSKYWIDRDYPLPQRYFEGGVTAKF